MLSLYLYFDGMAEHTYPGREGDVISALYISQLCESTSSGTLVFVKVQKEKIRTNPYDHHDTN